MATAISAMSFPTVPRIAAGCAIASTRRRCASSIATTWRRKATTPNRQGGDVGRSYRSAIFYTSEAQKRIAEDTIADVNASGLWPGRVVTELAPAGPFWEAEPEHQDYLERYPAGYTCHFVRPGWKLPVREKAAAAS